MGWACGSKQGNLGAAQTWPWKTRNRGFFQNRQHRSLLLSCGGECPVSRCGSALSSLPTLDHFSPPYRAPFRAAWPKLIPISVYGSLYLCIGRILRAWLLHSQRSFRLLASNRVRPKPSQRSFGPVKAILQRRTTSRHCAPNWARSEPNWGQSSGCSACWRR